MEPKSYLLNTNIRDASIQSMRLTNEEDVEHGFYITRNRGKLWMTPIQKGNDAGITLTHNFGESVATVHTHPIETYESLFSRADIASMLNGGMEWSVVIYDHNGFAIADLFDAKLYDSYEGAISTKKNSESDLESVRRLNKELLTGRYELGKL